MLLLHQAGSVKVGEVVRYTLTYTPASDRILPTPSHLNVKVKNTSAIPLRAAWVHGPYCLHVAAYPETFNPHRRVENPEHDGVPDYEPMLKAGGHWHAKLLVPDDIRETGADLGKRQQSADVGDNGNKGSVTWIVEIASQILFSSSASVNFELLVGRDERSLDLGFAAVAGHGHGGPGQVHTQATEKERKRARERGHVQTAGVYSKAVRLVVEDTETLWDKPPLPTREDRDGKRRKSTDPKRNSEDAGGRSSKAPVKRKKIHLVIVTHGLHGNLGADLLFLKESIDATVAQARLDAKKRKESYSASQPKGDSKDPAIADEADRSVSGAGIDGNEPSTAPLSGGQDDLNQNDDESDDDEETIVRGFPGNAVKTENGIQYLGKRLAKYVLTFTYPDQPFLPVKKPLKKALTDPFKSEEAKAKRDGLPSHSGSSIHHPTTNAAEDLPYKFTSISFVGHSLGGVIQTYAIAYIHKHNPTFFSQIRPVNFICMASPMLGLSNENPMYVKFALDFGLVGRTGQDLGLTWSPPTVVRGGWNAMIGGLGSDGKDQKPKEEDPAAKPLLRILPTGPAHHVLRMFRNRTVYSNVVNDGIVPLRTSCLLFLDWRGLGKVDKARRENGLIGTVAEWGWAEITGQNSSTLPDKVLVEAVKIQTDDDDDNENEHVRQGQGEDVPQPDEDETALDNKTLTTRASYDETTGRARFNSESLGSAKAVHQEPGMWDSFVKFFRSRTPTPERHRQGSHTSISKKTSKALRRGQTVYQEHAEVSEEGARGRSGMSSEPNLRPGLQHAHTGQTGQAQSNRRSIASQDSNDVENLEAPPKTSIFESAGDLLHPPLPSRQWILDPSNRARTIFHDRVYHPHDIPAPPVRRHSGRFDFVRSSGTDSGGKSSGKSSYSSHLSTNSQDSTESGGMKVEEKIARAYHRDLSWRKVLVRLEPDAHNNMIVRRMFANAYGWPVIKHLCDTHFGDTYTALTRTEEEPAQERAPAMEDRVPPTGEEVIGQTARHAPERTTSETREAQDELVALKDPSSYSSKISTDTGSRRSTGTWDDKYFEDADGDDSDVDERNLVARLINPNLKKPERVYQPATTSKSPQANGDPRTPPSLYTDGHRGLKPISPTMSRSPASHKSAASTKSTFDSAHMETPVLSQEFSEEPESMRSTATIGLRRSIEQQVSPVKGKGKASAKKESSSVAEAAKSTSASQD